jgi:homoserine dehydrogenase
MAESLGVGLIGCGTVGSGVAQVLLEHPDRLAKRAGRPIQLRRIVVRDPARDRGFALPPELVSTDVQSVLGDPSIQVVCELIGGTTVAREVIHAALAAGKDVITANKALLALHGKELFDAARKYERGIAFEASVAGGVPIISALLEGLAGNQVVSLLGILNGTCNFILSGMTTRGLAYEDALTEAQNLGYAEADPTMDVDGTDTAHKLAILAQIAFGAIVPLEQIERRGIEHVLALDVHFAGELGYVIKLLAEAHLNEGQLAVHVSPVLLRRQTPLAQIRGPYNAIHVVGDVLGDGLFYGQGAGRMATASAVLADLVDLGLCRTRRVLLTRRLWNGSPERLVIRPSSEVRTRFYLRLLVRDKPGTLSEVTRVLAQHQISIASVIQHEAPDEQEGDWVQLVIMTHTAATGSFRKAARAMETLGCVAAPAVFYPVGD